MIQKSIQQVTQRPLDPQTHYQLADSYGANKQWFAAIAEYRTALTLGSNDAQVLLSLARAYLAQGLTDLASFTCHSLLSSPKEIAKQHASPFLQRISQAIRAGKLHRNNGFKQEAADILATAQLTPGWPLSNLDHNRYYRLKTLGDHLLSLFGDSGFSILDVGGGDGALAVFIPQADYVLAEPDTNGISGANIPFAEKSFDVVLACHVLEHIPPAERWQFLDQLCLKAKKFVLLLNPFFQPDAQVQERIELIYALTQAQWAKEHLDCGLPELEEVTDFAVQRNYPYRVWPNGSVTTSLAMVFLNYYARLAGRQRELEKIHSFYNTRFFNSMTDTHLPGAYLIELTMNS